MTWETLPPPSTFSKARRREAYKKFARLVTRAPAEPELLPLDEVRERLRLFEQNYVGIRPIPVDHIIGSAGRTNDFDRNWLPLRPSVRQRWRRVEQAFPGGDWPPIIAYELDGSYFVIDGHHRVAIARQRKVDYIDAEITRLHSRYNLPVDADIGAILHAEQERIFMEESGLDRARPEARIEFSRPHGYIELLELIRIHGYHVMIDRDRVMSPEEIAGDWYDWLYAPAVRAMHEESLRTIFPDATDADLFLLAHQRRRALLPERGHLDLQTVAKEITETETKVRRALPHRSKSH